MPSGKRETIRERAETVAAEVLAEVRKMISKKGLLFASGLAYHAIHFPVPEGRAAVYDQGAAFNAGPLGGLGGLDFSMLALLPLGLLPEVLVGYAWDIAFVYVAVELNIFQRGGQKIRFVSRIGRPKA